MTKAIIFDLDGTIADTERLHDESFRTMLEYFGVTPRLNELGVVHTPGIGIAVNMENFKKQYEFEADTDEMIRIKNESYLKLLHGNIKAMPGLYDLLEKLKSDGHKLAIASSTIRPQVELIINNLKIANYFDIIVTGDEIKNLKPAPDIFLEAAKRLNTRPSECIVIEDAASGLQAGKAAGMRVIVVPNEFTAKADFNDADLKVESLENVYKTIVYSQVNQ
jgi:beta-phosphoglucomutase family hydrolase